jgi:hypothetical protein
MAPATIAPPSSGAATQVGGTHRLENGRYLLLFTAVLFCLLTALVGSIEHALTPATGLMGSAALLSLLAFFLTPR